MKRSITRLAITLCFILAALAPIRGASARVASGPESDSDDKTLSPYFFVKSEDPSVDRLPLKSTSATVNVSGVIADVVVVQVYKNEGTKPIEALYVFPASTRAAVYGMKMTIGERTIVAEIKKRDDARRVYEKAKQEGKSASLLEEQRPNVFQMNVANIMPGDEIRTELRYTELLVPTEGIYEFVYPTVVGPRYSNQPAATAPPSEKWSQNPYLHEGEAPPYTFGITAHVAGAVPIAEMTCPSHKTSIRYEGKTSATVDLDPSEKTGGNRDFILKYRLSGDAVESGMLLYQGEKENFFLLMMQPPKWVPEKEIPAREYVFIVDVSGSMNGYPLDISKKLLKDLLARLRPVDRFNVLLFAGASKLFNDRSVTANTENIKGALQLIDLQRGGGGTELLPALRQALALPATEGMSRTFVIATDGYVTVEPEAFDLIRANIGKANIFPFGIGTSVNRFLIEGMAHVGAGEPFVVTKPEEAPAMAEKFRRYIASPVLSQVKLDFGSFDAYDVEPPAVPDLFAERPVVVFGKWRGKAQGTITLTGTGGGGKVTKSIDLAGIKPAPEHAALRYLWARSAIGRLSDYNRLAANDDRTGKIADLGLKYSLLTAYTSFVAVDSEVRRHGGEATTVNQPLPLPEGVSNYAVGGVAPAMAAPAARGGGEGFFMKKISLGSSAPPNQVADSSEGRKEKDKAKAEPESAEASVVTVERVSVRGGVSEAEVRRVVEAHMAELRDSIRQAKVKTPARITLTWTIRADGTVADLKVASASGDVRGLKGRLEKILGKWGFPKPEGGNEAWVTVVLRVAR